MTATPQQRPAKTGAASLADVPIRRKAAGIGEIQVHPPVPKPKAVRAPQPPATEIHPAPPPQEPAAAAGSGEAPAPPVRPALPVRRPHELIPYWESRRQGRAIPAWSDFDAEEIGAQWPNCLLLTCTPGTVGGTITIARATRLGHLPDDRNSPEYGPMITEWMLALGRQVVRSGRPIQDIDDFPYPSGSIRCRITLMPLSDQPGRISHILCNLSRA